MKTIRFILSSFVLAMMCTITSCTDENSVYPSNDKYVRIDRSAIVMSMGEQFRITASVDPNHTYRLNWSISNTSIATIENGDNNAGIITAIAPGKAVVKVETADGGLKYFADLTITGGSRSVKLLTIGSGAAYDATAGFLHKIATNEGQIMLIGNLYVTGASLVDHLANIEDSTAVYQYNLIAADGGVSNAGAQSLRSVIKSENWDYIAIEESFARSGLAGGYQSALPKIVDYVKSIASNPNMKVALHQTWAYEASSALGGFANYGRDQTTMYNDIATVTEAAKSKVDMLVPSGTAIQNARTSYYGQTVLLNDSILAPNIGRLITGLTWYSALFKVDATTIGYKSDDMTNFDTNLAKAAAGTAITAPTAMTDMVDYHDKGPNEYIIETPIYIDFGATPSPAPWNNFLHMYSPPIENLKDSEGKSSAFQIGVVRGFNDWDITRPEMEINDLGFPVTVSRDCLFADGIDAACAPAILRFSYLTLGQKYKFVLYGGINDKNTEVEYVLTGKTEASALLALDNGNFVPNRDKYIVFDNFEPADDATITLTLNVGPHNEQNFKFIGINALIIAPAGYKLPFEP